MEFIQHLQFTWKYYLSFVFLIISLLHNFTYTSQKKSVQETRVCEPSVNLPTFIEKEEETGETENCVWNVESRIYIRK